jgi:L-malate glycosyltransferase
MQVMLLAPGFSVHSQRFLNLLLDAGYAVTLVNDYNPKPGGSPRYRFITYPTRTGFERFHFLRSANQLGEWSKVFQLRMIHKRVGPDLVHLHFVAGVHPFIMTFWGTEIVDSLARDDGAHTARRRLQQSLSAADHVTADSNEVLQQCEALVGQKLPTSLFYFGIDLTKFRPGLEEKARLLRQHLHVPRTAQIVLSARRLGPPMQQPEILKAFAYAIRDLRCEAVLILLRYLSQTSRYETELRDLANELGVSDNVLWLDGLENEAMPNLYAMADLVVNFPNADGLPVSLFEAAACKRPVITCGLEAYREFLQDSAFTIIPPGDVPALTRAIKMWLDHKPADWSARLETNYQLVARKADQRKWFGQLERTYQNLVEAHSKGK